MSDNKGRPARQHIHMDHKTGGTLDGRASKPITDLGHSIPFVIRCDFTGAGPNFAIFASNAPVAFRVIDFWVINEGTGAAADTALVDNGTTAITDALDLNVADKTVVRAGTIDDATQAIAKGGSLRIVTASAPVGTGFILCVREG